MINIRYALFSVGGMLVALAVGVVLGAGPLQGDADEHWRAEVRELDREKTTLERAIGELRSSREFRDEFVDSVDDGLIADTLTGHQIAIVVLPGAEESYAKRVRTTLEVAGATVTGQVDVEPRWAEAGQQQLLDDTATRLITDDTKLPPDGGAYDRAAAVLARALMTADPTGEPDVETTAILAGYGAAELVRADDQTPRADLAVVVAPEPRATAEDAVAQNSAWTAIAVALDRAGKGVVVVGDADAATDDGLIDALRGDPTAREAVSTVDVVDQVAGGVGVVYALAEQLNGEVGHYGTGDGADGVVAPMPPRQPAEPAEPSRETEPSQQTEATAVG